MLDILAGLPEHLFDRGALLRRLLAIERSVPAVEQASVLREVLQRWLPFGRQPKAFVAWAEFLEQCTDTEVRPLAGFSFVWHSQLQLGWLPTEQPNFRRS